MFGQSTKAAEEIFADIKTEKGWNSWSGSISDGDVGALNSNTSATTPETGDPTNKYIRSKRWTASASSLQEMRPEGRTGGNADTSQLHP